MLKCGVAHIVISALKRRMCRARCFMDEDYLKSAADSVWSKLSSDGRMWLPLRTHMRDTITVSQSETLYF